MLMKLQTSMATVSTHLPSIGTTSMSLSKGPHASHRSARTYMEDLLERMHHEIEFTTRKLEVERRRLFQLDEGLKRARNEIEEKRLKLRARKRKSNAIKLRKLESWLAHAISKLNGCSAQNEEYKMVIDRLRKERKNLDEVCESLRFGLRQVAGVLTKYGAAKDEHRAEVHDFRTKIMTMKKSRDNERQDFKETIASLGDDLRLQVQLKKEMGIRSVKFSSWESVQRGDSTRQFMVADEEEQFSDHLMFRRILKLAFLNCIQRRHIKQHQKNIEVFEQAFATIKSSTGISDIEQIVRIFVKLEERNFSLLTYVNQLNRETEAIEVSNHQIYEQMKLLETGEGAQRERRNRALSKLDQHLAKISSERKEKEEQGVVLQMITEKLIPGIRDICYQLGELEQSPTNFEGCTNIPAMLTMIEANVNFFREQSVQKYKFKEKPRDKGVIIRLSDLPSCNVQDSEDDEDGLFDSPDRVMPLSRTELKARSRKIRRPLSRFNQAQNENGLSPVAPKDQGFLPTPKSCKGELISTPVMITPKVSYRLEPGSVSRVTTRQFPAEPSDDMDDD